jgi:hypothetical protein
MWKTSVRTVPGLCGIDGRSAVGARRSLRKRNLPGSLVPSCKERMALDMAFAEASGTAHRNHRILYAAMALDVWLPV